MMTVALGAVDPAELLRAVEKDRAHMAHVAWAPLVVDLDTARSMAAAPGVRGVFVNGELAGLVALQPMDDGRLNFAAWIVREYEGYGVALEAGRQILATRTAEVVAPVDPSNARSVAYVARLGFVEGVLPCRG